jgi:hypothetical protein
MDDPPMLDDTDVPALASLLGREASLILDVAVRPTGTRIIDAQVRQVTYRPGRSVAVEYRATVVGQGSSPSKESFVAVSGGELPDSVAVVEADDFSVGVWRYPDDPHLPGLRAVADADPARALLDSVGAPPGPVRIRRRSYRPGRRGVLELVTPRSRVFAKVVRPGRVASLQAIHRAAASNLAIPRSLGWSADSGIVMLEAMRGRTVRTLLEKRRAGLPDPGALVSVLDQLPDPPHPDSGGASSSIGERATRHANLLRAILPRHTALIDRVLDRLRDAPEAEPVAIHGDFHSAQVLVRNGSVSGIIDVDTLRRGQRAEDLGRFIAHLSALRLGGKLGADADAYRESLVEHFRGAVHPSQLASEVAVSLLGYASGPFRVLEPGWQGGALRRIELADDWLQGD